jgi:hypothetical protein
VKWNIAGATYANNTAQIIVRSNKHNNEIIHAFDWNESHTVLAGNYDFEALTLPRFYLDTSLVSPGSLVVPFANNGLLSVVPSADFFASVYVELKGSYKLVKRMDLPTGKTAELRLQPGKYTIVYQSPKSYDSETTKSKQFIIEEEKTVVVYLQL